MSDSVSDPIYHSMPLVYGGDLEDEIAEHALPPLPPVDRGRASRPVTPGMPPVMHTPLLPPSAHQLIVSQLITYLQQRDEVSLADDLASLQQPSAEMAAALGAAVPAADAEPAPSGLVGGLVRRRLTPAAGGIRFDPVFAFLIYLALGFGTLYLDVLPRYAVLWTALAVGGGLLTLVDREDLEPFSSVHILWGVSIGLVFSLPLLILNLRGLADTSRVLYPFEDPITFFYAMVFVAPLGETLFFRGVVQEQRGYAASVFGAGLSSVLFYWPAASARPVYLIVAAVVTTVLAAVYSFFRQRLGIVAALTCQIAINVMLLFLPAVFF